MDPASGGLLSEASIPDLVTRLSLLTSYGALAPVVPDSVQGVQVHDARLVAYMQAHGVAHILTLNGADFARYPGITAIAPTDLLTAQTTP
jgi:hypothetical protein